MANLFSRPIILGVFGLHSLKLLFDKSIEEFKDDSELLETKVGLLIDKFSSFLIMHNDLLYLFIKYFEKSFGSSLWFFKFSIMICSKIGV